MQINKTHPECFKPFVLNICVETEEEATALDELFGLDASIPTYLKSISTITDNQKEIVSSMFAKLYHLI